MQFERYLGEGKRFLAKKDYPRAILQFRNASKAMPNNAEPYYQLGITAVAMGDPTAAAEFLSQTLAINPKHLDAMLALSELYIRSRHAPTLEEGKRLAQRALAIAPENAKALNLLAFADMRKGSVGAKTTGARLEDVLKRFPHDVETSINLARIRMMLNDREGAEKLLSNATANTPKDTAAIFALADFYYITGDLSKAAEWYTRGLHIEPDHAPVLAVLGRLHVKAGREREADAIFARLAQNPDRRFRYSHALRLFESGRKDAAIVEFTRLFKETPDDREARTHLINAYLSMDRYREAEDLLASAISSNPKDVAALVQRARIYLFRGAPDPAAKDLDLVLEYQPDSAEGHYLLAQVHRYRGNNELRQRELSEALRLNPNHSPARIELSQLLLGKDPKGALSIVDSAPEDQKQELALRIQRIWPLLDLNRVEEARTAIAALLSTGTSEVMLQNAVLHMRQNNFAASRAIAENVLLTNPADVRALELIMRCSVGDKRLDDGIEIVRRHAGQHTTLSAVQMFLGRVELHAGNVGKARAAFETAKAADPSALDAVWSLTDLDIAERKLDDARRRITPLVGSSNDIAATAKLGIIEQLSGNYKAASEHYRKVLQTKPREVAVLNNLAYILTEFLDNPTEALRYAQTAKELQPESAAVDDTLGWTYYKMGLYPSAVRHLELAVKREPSPTRSEHLAMAQAKSGRRTNGRTP
jgi:tetratricopeptide (TPR) repeat protein